MERADYIAAILYDITCNYDFRQCVKRYKKAGLCYFEVQYICVTLIIVAVNSLMLMFYFVLMEVSADIGALNS